MFQQREWSKHYRLRDSKLAEGSQRTASGHLGKNKKNKKIKDLKTALTKI